MVTAASFLPARPIRPRPVSGRWRRVKDRVALVVLALMFVVPHVPWARAPGEPQRAVLLDFAGGHAYVLGWVLGLKDLPLLMATLICAALLLFFTNSLVGRVWCGFACPQTIWTDLYRRIESRLMPIGGVWLARAAWLLASLATGYAMVSWFSPGGGLWGDPPLLATGFLLLFTAFTYVMAAHAQELVCLYMCPWPRIQAAMVDADTRLVSYDERRGEPRGPLKRMALAGQPRGACIDCGLCVQVCPMGIDIRRGQQLACIGCGLCADACDQVMTRTGQAPGLIAFASQRGLEMPAAGGEPADPIATGRPLWKRPRPLAYGALVMVTAGATLALVAARSPVMLSLQPDRGRPYVLLSDGSIRNIFDLHVRTERPLDGPVRLAVRGLPDAEVQLALAGGAPLAVDGRPLALGESGLDGRLLVTLASDRAADGTRPFELVLLGPAGETLSRAEARFNAPEAGRP